MSDLRKSSSSVSPILRLFAVHLTRLPWLILPSTVTLPTRLAADNQVDWKTHDKERTIYEPRIGCQNLSRN